MSNVKIFAELIDNATKEQIYNIANKYPHEEAKIRIMPDCHLGNGSCIGYTEELDYGFVDPSFVGVDIGCGVSAYIFKTNKKIDYEKLDNFITHNIPHGFSINQNTDNFDSMYSKSSIFGIHKAHEIEEICSKIDIDFEKVKKSLGSLGGGNHFIEFSYDESEGFYALIVHSGSRNFGLKVANYYIQMSKTAKKDRRDLLVRDAIDHAKKVGEVRQISKIIEDINTLVDEGVPENCVLIFNSGYFDDMQVVQNFAKINRLTILNKIMDFMKKEFNINSYDIAPTYIDTPHNYLEYRRWETNAEDRKIILRKGAISANAGESVLIPFNMREGTILAIGKGNDDWNRSAPHGAGRILSRTQAKENLKDSDVENIMKGIYTSTAKECIDELPDAYKPMDKILPLLSETVDVIRTFKPLYNFKAKN